MMSAVTKKTSSTVARQPRSTRTSEGIRAKSSQGIKTAPSSRQGAKPSSSLSTLNARSNLATTTKPKSGKKQQTDALREKEDEYRRLNAELEAKTSELVKEAEELLKGNLSILSDLDPSSSLSAEEQRSSSPALREPDISRIKIASNIQKKGTNEKPKTSSSHAPPSRGVTRSTGTASGGATCPTGSTSAKATKQRQGPTQPTDNLSTIHNHPKTRHSGLEIGLDLDETVQRLQKEMDDVTITSPSGAAGARGAVVGGRASVGLDCYDDDILPGAAEHMGSEATIRFLKAKLRVMQEEMDRLCQECTEKDKQLSVSEAKLKELSEQNAKLQRSHKSVSSQVDKYRQSSETLKRKCEGLEAQLISLGKEVDGMKSSQQKASGKQSALEVRLNRALEETDKYKSALQKARSDLKESSKQEHLKLEQLTAENKQLTKQKTELIAAFKKQLKLIDVLKRQKMHLEAAKMLSFTEEEFVKALDWGAS